MKLKLTGYQKALLPLNSEQVIAQASTIMYQLEHEQSNNTFPKTRHLLNELVFSSSQTA